MAQPLDGDQYYSERIEEGNGDIRYEIHENSDDARSIFITIEGREAKSVCNKLMKALNGK